MIAVLMLMLLHQRLMLGQLFLLLLLQHLRDFRRGQCGLVGGGLLRGGRRRAAGIGVVRGEVPLALTATGSSGGLRWFFRVRSKFSGKSIFWVFRSPNRQIALTGHCSSFPEFCGELKTR